MKVDGSKLQHTNESVRFDTTWLQHIDAPHKDFSAHRPFLDTLQHACKYGEPGLQFDDDEQTLRNACTEVISADDSDSCCIGSINLAAIKDLDELRQVISLGILFLLCNTLYTDTPTQQVANVKQKNRRLGLGLMGVAEWFIQRGLRYGDTQELLSQSSAIPFSNGHVGQIQHRGIGDWLRVYQQESELAAVSWADKLSISTPVATRAIAPTGTISIVGGHTTPGIEPVFHTAYKRTSNTLKTQQYSDGYKIETVIDPIVHKWIEQGYDVRDIDTAYTLSQSISGIERRIQFQAYVQQFVDNGISSTVNLPQYVPGIEDKIAPILLKYLPQLRGITFYPDGRYDNQPVTPIDIGDVLGDGSVHMQEHDACNGGECGL